MKRQTFDNGAQGAAVTAGSTAGSGDPLYHVVVTGAATGTFDETTAVRGAKGCRVQASAGAASAWTALLRTPAASDSLSSLTAYRVNALPSANVPIDQAWSATARMCALTLTTTGDLYAQDAAGANIGPAGAATIQADLVAGDVIWVAKQVTKGATTSNGAVAYQVYDGGGTLIATRESTAANTGTAQAVDTRVGQLGSVNASYDITVDEMFVDATSTPIAIPPTSANVAPAVTASAGTPVPAVRVPLAATATDTDGTVASYAWTITNRPAGSAAPLLIGATASAATLYVEVGGTYTAQVVVTDDDDTATTTQVTVTVPPPATQPRTGRRYVATPDGWR